MEFSPPPIIESSPNQNIPTVESKSITDDGSSSPRQIFEKEAFAKSETRGGYYSDGDVSEVNELSPAKPFSTSTNFTVDRALSRKQRKLIMARRQAKLKRINKEHPEFELSFDMMLGIRTTVSRVEGIPIQRPICEDDFSTSYKLRMPAEGSLFTPAHKMRNYKFKDYAPEVFRRLRARFGIDPADYLLSVCGDFSYLEFIANSQSGQFFFYTGDRQFMIKTITKTESKFLRSILPAYFNHVTSYPDTLLTRYFGMHRVKPHKSPEMHFLVMGSVYYTEKFIHTVYDLKGSSQGRKASESEKKQEVPVLKDLDFIENKVVIRVGPERAAVFKQQLQYDCEFLSSQNIMDYSLLLGIHFGDNEEKILIEDDSTEHSASDPSIPTVQRAHSSSFSAGATKRKQSNYGLKSTNLKKNLITSPVSIDLTSLSPNPSDPPPPSKPRATTIHNSISCFNRDDGGVRALDEDLSPSNTFFFFGIIDMLGQYTMLKKAEHHLKSLKYDSTTISAVNPRSYADRFSKFLTKYVE